MVKPTALRQCGWLAGVTAGLWLVLAGPAYLVAGTPALEGLCYAALLCLIPGWLVFLISLRYGVANGQAAVMLWGTGLRLLFVLFGVLAIRSYRADLGLWEFLVWIIFFYSTTLLVETLLLVKQSSA